MKRLIVSLHDVAPPFEAEIRAQLDALAAVGVNRCVLKVVPNWHGKHPLTASPSFTAMLRTQLDGGSEVVLHGLEHRRQGPLRGPTPRRLRAELFAGDACEFLTLAPGEARQSVLLGRELFERAGLPAPATFCAPGWLLAPDLLPALAEAGMSRLVGMFSVCDLTSSRRRTMPALGHMGVSPPYEAGIQLCNRLALLAGRWAPLLKVFLHPQGGTRSAAARWVLGQVCQLSQAGWKPVTYAEVLRDCPRPR